MDEKTHRLSAVDDELEIGFDQTFERKWRRLELASQVVMGLFVLAALVGLFGRGPLSHRTHATADGRLALDFEPLARWGTATQITVHLSGQGQTTSPAEGAVEPARLFVNNAIIEPLGLQQVIPQPDATKAAGGGAVYEFAIPPNRDSALVRFILKPSQIGLVNAEVREGGPDGVALSLTQLVLP
jgi:hypothetical protein